MQLKVNEKEYTVTYKFKAMYDSEFIKEMFETFNNMNSEDDNSGIEMFAYLAQKTTNMLLVGLQEEHSQEFKTFDDAMDLIQKYFTENEVFASRLSSSRLEKRFNMLGLYTELINTMSEDGFLERIGLVDKKEQVKTPQDHKKKTTTTSKK